MRPPARVRSTPPAPPAPPGPIPLPPLGGGGGVSVADPAPDFDGEGYGEGEEVEIPEDVVMATAAEVGLTIAEAQYAQDLAAKIALVIESMRKKKE